MSGGNPFGDDPFGDTPSGDPTRRIRSAAAKIRSLKGQVGHDGFTPSAARTLLDEITRALDTVAAALEELKEEKG